MVAEATRLAKDVDHYHDWDFPAGTWFAAQRILAAGGVPPVWCDSDSCNDDCLGFEKST